MMLLRDEMIVLNNSAVVRSYAKINLTLDVCGKRDDGYHNISTVMQSVGLYDTLIVNKAKSGITIISNAKYIPLNEKNIAYKAASAFFRYTNILGGVKIKIQKNIPVGAGLAGGSGNAAAVLVALNVLYNTFLTKNELSEIALTLGADVPYCLRCGTYLAEGIGEILTPLNPVPIFDVVIVKPQVSISTAAIYKSIDNAEILERPDNKRFISALKSGDKQLICSLLCNVMENVSADMYPVIGEIKSKLKAYGAMGALMSGSGSAVFGLFGSYEKAKLAHDKLSQKYNDVFLCRTK